MTDGQTRDGLVAAAQRTKENTMKVAESIINDMLDKNCGTAVLAALNAEGYKLVNEGISDGGSVVRPYGNDDARRALAVAMFKRHVHAARPDSDYDDDIDHLEHAVVAFADEWAETGPLGCPCVGTPDEAECPHE